MILSFCGPSGSGKSTLLKEVKKNAFFSDKKIYFRKEDDFIFIHLGKLLFGNKIFSDYKRVKFFEKKFSTRLSLFSILVTIFYPLLIYIEFLYEYLYYEIFFNRKILLRDRYIYDYLVTIKDILGIQNPLVESSFKAFPKPSLLFYVKIDRETALQRNKNNVSNKITAKQSFHTHILNSYDQIAKTKKILVLDNTKPLQESIKDMNRHINNWIKLSLIKTVAIIGLDGSGKSTLSVSLKEYLDQLNIDSAIVHFYHDNLLYKFLKILGFFSDSQNTTQKTIPSRSKPAIWGFLTWIDSYIQYAYARTRYNRRLIIFDRYFYDYLVSFKFLNIKGISILRKTIPSPTIAIWVACEPQTALRRKPENSLDFFVSGYESYKEIAKKYKMNIVDSTAGNWEEIFEQVLDILTKKYI